MMLKNRQFIQFFIKIEQKWKDIRKAQKTSIIFKKKIIKISYEMVALWPKQDRLKIINFCVFGHNVESMGSKDGFKTLEKYESSYFVL